MNSLLYTQLSTVRILFTDSNLRVYSGEILYSDPAVFGTVHARSAHVARWLALRALQLALECARCPRLPYACVLPGPWAVWTGRVSHASRQISVAQSAVAQLKRR